MALGDGTPYAILNKAKGDFAMSDQNHSSEIVEIQLTQGYTTIVSSEDSDLSLMKWSVRIQKDKRTQYAIRRYRVNGKQKRDRMHRVILSRMLGRELLPSEEVDHINLNGLDNRRNNLRLATRFQNAHNMGLQKNNTSGYKGVSWDKNHCKWFSKITVNKKQIYLGLYETVEEAFLAYCNAAKKYHGEFANDGKNWIRDAENT
jgi:hypothetical protein